MAKVHDGASTCDHVALSTSVVREPLTQEVIKLEVLHELVALEVAAVPCAKSTGGT